MLLEVNRLQHLIIDRPRREEVERLARLCGILRTCMLVDDDVQWWNARVPGTTLVLSFNTTYLNDIAGNIRDALLRLEAQPYNSIYLSFNPLSIPEAVGTRIGTVLISQGVGQTLPDLFTQDMDNVERAIADLAERRAHGYIIEQFSLRYGQGKYPGSTGYLSFQPFLRGRQDLDAAIAHSLEVVVGGRYFPETESRHAKHQPSLRMLYAKRGDRRGAPLIPAFAHTLHLVKQSREDIDLITRIPPKPNKPDNIGNFLQSAASDADARFDADVARLVKALALRCVRDYGEQKKAGNFRRRVQNVEGAFAADSTIVRGKRVLVVDDILTSGATMTEAARRLYAAGATSVMACPIAINQSEINYDPNYELQCPREHCSGNMRIRFAAKTEGAFWGCDQWRADGTGCSQMMTFAEGMTAANRLTDRDSIMVFGNVPF